MARLKADRAEAVRLHDLQGFAYAQVSQHMGNTLSYAQGFRTYAICDLRQLWSKLWSIAISRQKKNPRNLTDFKGSCLVRETGLEPA